jgi:LuxR family maltose regulon positive regulatory protein
MGRKSGKNTPTIISGTLYTDDPNTTGISLKEAAWSAWLEDAKTFYYSHPTGAFSARKQAHRHGYFWYAYKRIAGKLVKRYIGGREVIDQAKLEAMAASYSEIQSGTHPG